MMLLQATPTNFASYQSTITNILSNASITPIGTAIQGVAISLVAVTALVGIYEAFFDGGNLRAAAVTMLKYIIVAYIITNWTSLFQTMITDMATVTNTLQGGANVNTDVYDAFNQSLQTYYASTGDGILTQLFNAASGQILMVVLTAICSFIESAAYMFFCFWYTFWGAILWGIGPIIIALLPSSGLGRYATAYLSKVGEWLMWPILYAILGAIMVALNMNTATAILNTNSSSLAAVTTGVHHRHLDSVGHLSPHHSLHGAHPDLRSLRSRRRRDGGPRHENNQARDVRRQGRREAAAQVEALVAECMPRPAEVEAVAACRPGHSIAAMLPDRAAGECLLRTLPRLPLKWVQP